MFSNSLKPHNYQSQSENDEHFKNSLKIRKNLKKTHRSRINSKSACSSIKKFREMDKKTRNIEYFDEEHYY